MTPERGAIPVDLDKPRIIFFDHVATAELIRQYGPTFVAALYELAGEGTGRYVRLKDADALAFFLWAGVQRDARAASEEYTLDQAKEQIRPWTIVRIFNAVVMAITGATYTPPLPGKTPAAAKPATPAAMKGPGPTKVTTSLKRSGSPSASSAGRPRSSGSRRRGK